MVSWIFLLEGTSPTLFGKRPGCSITELNRWAHDGRLGKRWTSLGGGYHKWLRAWLPATIEAVASQIEGWREQDRTLKRFARRGLRVQDFRQ
jgi:hypothetical protein